MIAGSSRMWLARKRQEGEGAFGVLVGEEGEGGWGDGGLGDVVDLGAAVHGAAGRLEGGWWSVDEAKANTEILTLRARMTLPKEEVGWDGQRRRF